MVAHRDLTGADLHEPKGITSAPANSVYAANGVGSGTWKKITIAEIDENNIRNLNRQIIAVTVPDISTIGSVIVPIPVSATLSRATGSLSGAISGADAVITLSNNGSATIGTFTVLHTGSAEGDTYQLVATVHNTFTAGTFLKIATDGASTGAQRFTIVLEFTLT